MFFSLITPAAGQDREALHERAHLLRNAPALVAISCAL